MPLSVSLRGFERAVVGSAQHAATAAVVKQSVDGFLQHALFVAHDHVGRAKFHEFLQPVVAVDDAAIQIVQVGSGEAAAIEWHQRTQFRRKDRDHVQNHPLRLVAALAEGFQHLRRLANLMRFCRRRIGLHFLAKLIGEFSTSTRRSSSLMASAPIVATKLAGIFGGELAVFLFVKQLAFFEDGDFARVDNDERFEVENALEVAHGNVQQVADAARADP